MTTVTRKDQNGKEWEVNTKYLTDTPDNPQDWLDELYYRCDLSNNRTENPVGLEEFKTIILNRFTAQAKQHQIELLRARIDELERAPNADPYHDDLTMSRIKQLQAELAKLEGGADE